MVKPHERIRGRHYNGEIVEFAETVNNKLPVSDLSKADSRWGLGIWLGKWLSSDEHYVGTPQGVVRMYSINGMDAGRSPAEVLRTCQAEQVGGLCGANWKKGDDFAA